MRRVSRSSRYRLAMPSEAIPPNIRLIALDLDGTTLTSDRRLHPRNITAIQQAAARGVTVVLASGRIRPSMLPYATELGLGSGPLICSNGAHVVGPRGDNLVENHLTDGLKNAVIDFAEANELHLNAYTTDQMFFIEPSKWLDLYKTRARTIPAYQKTRDEIRALNLIKLMIIAEPPVIRSLAQRGNSFVDVSEVSLTESEPEYLEFLPGTANKGEGLRALANHMGIPREQVMAVGDYLNDLEMVRWAGYGVAMGNAVDAVKAAAKHITLTNDEAGVAIAIETVLQ